MARPIFADTKVQVIGAVVIILAAVVLGLTKFTFSPPPSVNTPPTNSARVSNLSFPGQLPEAELTMNVRLTTNRGDIVFRLDPAAAPLATSNFVYLVKQKFYDGIVWHRVESWVVQAGDPQTLDPSVDPQRWGTGGPGYTIPDEMVTGEYAIGTVAMARTPAPNSAGSQFFIMKQPMALDKVYAIFGQVISGIEVVQTLTAGDQIITATLEPTA